MVVMYTSSKNAHTLSPCDSRAAISRKVMCCLSAYNPASARRSVVTSSSYLLYRARLETSAAHGTRCLAPTQAIDAETQWRPPIFMPSAARGRGCPFFFFRRTFALAQLSIQSGRTPFLGCGRIGRDFGCPRHKCMPFVTLRSAAHQRWEHPGARTPMPVHTRAQAERPSPRASKQPPQRQRRGARGSGSRSLRNGTFRNSSSL